MVYLSGVLEPEGITERSSTFGDHSRNIYTIEIGKHCSQVLSLTHTSELVDRIVFTSPPLNLHQSILRSLGFATGKHPWE